MNRKIVQTTSLKAAREATDVHTQTSGVRRHVARGFPWCNRGLDRSGRGFAAFHALCPPDQLGAHRDRLQLQRPERHRGKIRNCTRQTAPADESYLCLAWLRGRMWPLRLHHRNHTRGNRTVRSRRPTVLQLKPLSFLERPTKGSALSFPRVVAGHVCSGSASGQQLAEDTSREASAGQPRSKIERRQKSRKW